MEAAVLSTVEGDGITGRVQFLRSELTRHIKNYKDKQTRNKMTTSAIRVVTILAGGCVTILLGVKGYMPHEYADTISVAALILSACISMLSAWETFSEHAWRWIQARMTVAMLLAIRDDLEFALTGKLPLEEKLLDELYARLKVALQSANDEWRSKRAAAINRPVDLGHVR